jgi:CBS domain-containing protein
MNDDTVIDLLRAKPGPDLLSVALDSTVTYAVCLMNHHGVGGVLVMEGKRLAGIFTERDVLRRVIEPGLDPGITRIGEVCSGEPITIDADEPAARAVDAMVEGGFRHLPVVEKGSVRGLLSMRDLTSWLIRRLQGNGGAAQRPL